MDRPATIPAAAPAWSRPSVPCLSARALSTPEPLVRAFARRVQQEGALDLTQGSSGSSGRCRRSAARKRGRTSGSARRAHAQLAAATADSSRTRAGSRVGSSSLDHDFALSS